MAENNSQYMYSHFKKYFHYSYTILSLTFTEYTNQKVYTLSTRIISNDGAWVGPICSYELE